MPSQKSQSTHENFINSINSLISLSKFHETVLLDLQILIEKLKLLYIQINFTRKEKRLVHLPDSLVLSIKANQAYLIKKRNGCHYFVGNDFLHCNIAKRIAFIIVSDGVGSCSQRNLPNSEW